VVYASLYPFADWRDQGLAAWEFLVAPLPKYWTGFDVATNVVGYVPLGFLLGVAALRSHWWRPGRHRRWAVAAATGAAALLSLLLEALQFYLPARIPSNVDLVLNAGGGCIGALLAALAHRLGAVDRWSRFRARWVEGPARGALVLLALWPAALLFPAPVPLGLGQVFERAEAAVVDALVDTPFLDWVPVRGTDFEPLGPGAETLVVALGLLLPCLLGFSIVRARAQRAAGGILVLLVGLLASALSAALSWGPAHTWEWLNTPVQAGLWAGLLLAACALPLPPRACAAALLLASGIYLTVLNQAPADAYFAQTLQTWEQGRFIRFHGLAQWLQWLWPYAAVAYALVRLSARRPVSRMPE
jgi:VanZ family protein